MLYFIVIIIVNAWSLHKWRILVLTWTAHFCKGQVGMIFLGTFSILLHLPILRFCGVGGCGLNPVLLQRLYWLDLIHTQLDLTHSKHSDMWRLDRRIWKYFEITLTMDGGHKYTRGWCILFFIQNWTNFPFVPIVWKWRKIQKLFKAQLIHRL